MSTFKRHWAKVLFTVLVVSLLNLFAVGQSITGTISGTVMDPSGGVVPNASVLLINEQTSTSRGVNTNEEGGFTFAAIQPGSYTLRVEQQGFRTFERKNNVVSANENLALGNLALSVGEIAEIVTTTAEGATVETASSDLTARLTSDQISL